MLDDGIVISIYDQETKILTLCCVLCGAVVITDMTALDEEDEADIPFDHEDDCPVGVLAVDKFN